MTEGWAAGRRLCTYCAEAATTTDEALMPLCEAHAESIELARRESEWVDRFAGVWASDGGMEGCPVEDAWDDEVVHLPPPGPIVEAGREPMWWVRMTNQIDARDGQRLWEQAEYPIDEMHPARELFEGGPTVAQIRDWRHQYGAVYVTSFDVEVHLVWRPAWRWEWRGLQAKIDNVSDMGVYEQNNLFENELAALCTLAPHHEPADFVRGRAGIPSLLTQQIMAASGFSAVSVRQL